MPKKALPKSSSSPPGTKGGAGGKCIACEGKGISSKGSRCHPCGGTGKKKVGPLSGVITAFSKLLPVEETGDMSQCWSCNKPSLYNMKAKKFVGYCRKCKDLPF